MELSPSFNAPMRAVAGRKMGIKGTIVSLLLAVVGLSKAHGQGALFLEAATGQIKSRNESLKRENRYSLEAGLRGRYVFQQIFFGAETDLGLFNKAAMYTEWLDLGFSKRFFGESLRINFGGGMDLIGFTETINSGTGQPSTSPYYQAGPFIGCDFEFKKISLRVNAPLQSAYAARVALGFGIF